MFLGIYEKAINQKFNWNDKIEIAKAAGFDFIELSIDESDFRLARLDWSDQEINDLKKLLDQHNFYFNSMALSALRKYPYGSKSKEIQEKALLITEKAIILAKKLGIRIIQLAGYDVYYEKGDQESAQNFLNNIFQVANLAQKYSVMLAFEIMDTQFMGTITRALNYLNQVNSPWLKIYPDIGNLSQWTNDIASELKKGINDIVAIHVKDTRPNTFRDVAWGEGTVDFQLIFSELKKLNYQGPYLLEMWSTNNKDETKIANITKLQSAKAFFESFKR